MNNWKKSKQEFLNRWPLEAVKSLTLDEYTNIERDDSFTYWLEIKTSDVIGVGGGSAFKFGIFMRNPNAEEKDPQTGQLSDSERKYGWYERFGDSQTTAFSTIKKLLIKTIQAAKNKDFSIIDDINLGHSFKWKVAYMYAPADSLLRIVKDNALKYLCSELLGHKPKKTSTMYIKLLSMKPQEESFDDYSVRLWNKFERHEKSEKAANQLNKTKEINPADQIIKEYPLNQILYGPPGTGKTYSTVVKALAVIEQNSEEALNMEPFESLKNRYDDFVSKGQIVFTTFHQSMAYEDFVEGLKPISENGQVTYDVLPGLFKKLCIKASSKKDNDFDKVFKSFTDSIINSDDQLLELKTKTDKPFWVSVNSNQNLGLYTREKNNLQGSLTKEKLKLHSIGEQAFPGWEGYANAVVDELQSKFGLVNTDVDSLDKKFVLIIDEINRGNVSSIFGELITLIEESKRKGNTEALEVTLPYSKEPFSVPRNLYIIGTMNTADRSVEALDSALRRRFSFISMQPNPDLIEQPEGLKEDLAKILKTINKRIEVLLDKDHLIGHSFFMKVENLEDLKRAFADEIIPLLQEYFFGDYGQISMVLGEGFCEGKITANNTKLFAETNNNYDQPDFSDKLIYEFPLLEDDEVFIKAINKLLKKKD